MSQLPRLPILVWIGLASAVLMVIGSFGPWAKALGLVNLSVSGTDGSNDGWLVVGAAIGGSAMLLLYERARQARQSRMHLLLAVFATAAGVLGAWVTISDRSNLTEASSDGPSDLVTVQVGWGLNLAMASSIALALVGGITFLRGLSVPETSPAEAGVSLGNTPSAATSSVTDITRLAELHGRGLLTEDEFRLAKERALGVHPTDE